MNLKISRLYLVLILVILIIPATLSLSQFPLDRSHPLVIGLGGIFLIVILLRPHIGVYAMVATFWLSTLFTDAGGLTLNRLLGIVTLAGVVLPWIAEKPKNIFKTFDYVFFGFLGVVILSVAINNVYPRTWPYFWDMLMGYLLYWLICQTIDNVGKLKILLWVIVFCNFVVALSVYNSFNAIGVNVTAARVAGLQAVNTVGYFGSLAIIIVLWLLRSQRKGILSLVNLFLYGLVLLFAGAMVLTGNRSGFLGLFVSLLVIWIFSRGMNVKLGIIFVVVLVVIIMYMMSGIAPAAITRVMNVPLGFNFEDDMKRVFLYQAAWRMFVANPILGIGFGGYGYNLAVYADSGSTAIAHNIFLSTLAEIGLLGFLVLLTLLGILIKDMWKYIDKQLIHSENAYSVIYAFALLVCMNVNYLFHGSNIDRLTFIVFSLGTVIVKLLESEENNGLTSQSVV